MDTLASVSPRQRAQAGLTATIVSSVTHAALLLLFIWQAGPAVIRELNDVLPALYLYAPDRRPSELREMRIPIPAPPGVRDGVTVPRSHEAPGSEAPAPANPLRAGLAPPGRTTMRIDSVFSAIAVDSEVVRYPSAAPIYPPKLLQSGIEGSVEAEFVVDTTGRVDLSTVSVVNSTDEEFTESVRTALAGAAFRPAWRNLRKVRQLVHQRFSFRLYRGPDSVRS
jgi:TonB family protein